MAEFQFRAPVVYWRGPAPFVFAQIPAETGADVAKEGRSASYGWGCIPVAATIGGVAFTTALIPRDGTYLLPLKVAVRRKLEMAEGAVLDVEMSIRR